MFVEPGLKKEGAPVIENFIWIVPILRGHLSYKVIFSLSQRWPLNTGLTVLTSNCGSITRRAIQAQVSL
jgi:hypothetical protein